jgi:hypothetical protein
MSNDEGAAAMALIQLGRERRQESFDSASRAASTQTATVELTGLSLGHGHAADHVRFNGMSYEPERETLTLFLEGLEHRVRHPKSIHVDQDEGLLHSVEAVDADGLHHIVQFHSALAVAAH